MDEHKTTTAPLAPRRLDPDKAVEALMLAGTSLLTNKEVFAIEDAHDKNPSSITRDKWNQAAKNLLDSGRLNKVQTNRLKGLRERMRRTKVKS